jgi:hypothetical protein
VKTSPQKRISAHKNPQPTAGNNLFLFLENFIAMNIDLITILGWAGVIIFVLGSELIVNSEEDN